MSCIGVINDIIATQQYRQINKPLNTAKIFITQSSEYYKATSACSQEELKLHITAYKHLIELARININTAKEICIKYRVENKKYIITRLDNILREFAALQEKEQNILYE